MQWSTPHAAWLFVASAAVLVALLYLARRLATAPSARGLLLLVLRAGVYAVLLFILGNPVRVSEARLPARLPGVIQLVDVSRSMGLDSPQSRLAQVQQALDLSAYSVGLETPPFEQVPGQATATSGHRTANIVVSAFDGDRSVAQTSVDFQILDDSPEYRDPRPDPALLAELAAVSGGQVLHNPQELANLLNSFPVVPGESAVFKTPLWDRAWIWFTLVALLAAEWMVRRAWGLG